MIGEETACLVGFGIAAFLLGMTAENWRLCRRLDQVVGQVRRLGREFAEGRTNDAAPTRSVALDK